jgi:hypothetical protein
MPFKNNEYFQIKGLEIDKLPSEPGVYGFSGPERSKQYPPETWVYIACADDIRHEISARLSADSDITTRWKPSWVSYESCPRDKMSARAGDLIRELQPMMNQLF